MLEGNIWEGRKTRGKGQQERTHDFMSIGLMKKINSPFFLSVFLFGACFAKWKVVVMGKVLLGMMENLVGLHARC